MKREFYHASVAQRTSDGYFNATDLLKYYNKKAETKKAISRFWDNETTQNFMQALANKENSNVQKSVYLKSDLYDSKRGNDGGTYMHPILFVKFAMWLSPEFEVEVITWIHDNLIDFRNKAGDYYKEMCSALQQWHIRQKGMKPDPMIFIDEARYINTLIFGDGAERKRNEASEAELEKLNRIQLANIELLNNNEPQRWEKLRLFARLLK